MKMIHTVEGETTMKKKWIKLSIWSLILALTIFVWAYYLYHYVTPEGKFTFVYHSTCGKPYVTLLFAIWGVMFLFGGVMSLLIAHIFYEN